MDEKINLLLPQKKTERCILPLRDPITREIYDLLIQASGNPTYTSVRLRITFCLLTLTGIRVSELLPLKVGQLQTLLEEYWIGIDCSKRGSACVIGDPNFAVGAFKYCIVTVTKNRLIFNLFFVYFSFKLFYI